MKITDMPFQMPAFGWATPSFQSVTTLSLAFGGVLLVLATAYIAVRRGLRGSVYRTKNLSPERITGYSPLDVEDENPPIETLAASIIERANEIRRAMEDDSSEVRAEMCAIGYRRCANDLVTLTHHVNEEVASASFVRRTRLKRLRKRAVEALSKARQSLPADALKATRQEK